MGISSIDLMQTEQIEALQNDVKELREKLNLLVSDITDEEGVENDNGVVATRDGLTVKLNQAIADAADLDHVIMDGYGTASGGGSQPNVGILYRLDELFQKLMDHSFTDTPYSYPRGSGMPWWPQAGSSHQETHPEIPGAWNGQGATSRANIDGTIQDGAVRTLHTSTAETVDPAEPVYVAESKSIITLKTIPEKRAKKLARKIQGQITAEDRVNTKD